MFIINILLCLEEVAIKDAIFIFFFKLDDLAVLNDSKHF